MSLPTLDLNHRSLKVVIPNKKKLQFVALPLPRTHLAPTKRESLKMEY